MKAHVKHQLIIESHEYDELPIKSDSIPAINQLYNFEYLLSLSQ